ncbi:alpha/beta fold hydrolase [Acidisphaera sp. L21]|uniref:bifunctional 3-oxoadipate enol-lactonase/4-carboxymuconolactone decarboxylase PcaDC n=1 Tax=Acidisphaera sp. L21 TaxID=1641851 RepID=UPI00131DFF9C|nr:alpha/beta fold hydrolase [Acidisphaera sp. L21]
MPFVTRDGVRLYWRADGHPDRPALLLLHGVGTDHAVWDGVVRALSGRFRLLRMDARGHGASDVPPGDYTIAELAADAVAVLDAAGAAKAVVAGLSMGGMTVMQMAIATPERLTGIAICNSTAEVVPQFWLDRAASVRANGMASMTDAIMTRWFPASVLAAKPAYLSTARATSEAQEPQGYIGCCMAIAGLAVKDGLPAITLPTLVVVGSLDQATPPATGGEPIAAAIPGAQLVSLPTGHISPLERPDALAAALADFFAAGSDDALEAGRLAIFERGIGNRRAVLGDAWVDKALAKQGGFAWEFQQFITRFAWSEVWGRPGLDHRTRRIIVLSITIALGRWEEFRLHTRSALEQKGLTEEEVREVLIQSAIYAGVPAANTAFHMVEEMLAEMHKA